MATDPLIPTIDYTSRDYEAVRADMIRLIRARVPQWTADNPSDFGVALVEAFAYGIDILNYYLDRVGNEAYLSTAVQRESLYSIAEMFNYVPRSALAASVFLNFTNSTHQDIVVPPRTRCQASVTTSTGTVLKNFETTSEVVVGGMPPNSVEPVTSPDIFAEEGRTYLDEAIGVSNGFARQQYLVPRGSVVPFSIRVSTGTTAGGATDSWVEIADLSDATSEDRMFQVVHQTDGSSMVRFGDSQHGMIPPMFSVIRASYRVGGGSDGNVPPHTINTLVDPLFYGLSVTNRTAAVGGQDQESLSSIRVNAARSFRSRDRAVTLIDFVSLTENIPEVAKAKAVGNNGSSVTIYVCPLDDGTGRPMPTAKLLDDVRRYIEERSMAGVTITVLPPSWMSVWMKMTVQCLPTAYRADVEAAVKERLARFYGFDNVQFDGRVAVSDIIGALTGTPGLDYVEVQDLSTDKDFTAPISLTTIKMTPGNALQYFSHPTHLSLTMSGGAG